MALVLNLTAGAESSDCTTITLTDSTGTYNASTNPGGYGTPNWDRADTALLLFVTWKGSDGDEAISITAYNEFTVTSWSITIAKDGWYQYALYGCPVYDGATSYVLNNVVYYDDKFYIALGPSTGSQPDGNPSDWAEITSVATMDDANNVYEDIVNDDVKCFTNQCAATYVHKYVCANCGCADKEGKLYERIRRLIESAEYSWDKGDRTDFQEKIEKATEICDDTDCGCGCS